MTLSVLQLGYSTIAAPCCGRPLPDREPVPPGWMLLDGEMPDGLAGMVSVKREVMHPTLRGTRPWVGKMAPGPRLGCCGTAAGARRTAMSGLGRVGRGPGRRGLRAFDTNFIDEAITFARQYAPADLFTLPPSPADLVDAVWRLAENERSLEVYRRKMRTMNAAGLLTTDIVTSFDKLRGNWFQAAKEVYLPIVNTIREASPAAAGIIPTITKPPGWQSAGADTDPLPWVPDRAAFVALREGRLNDPAVVEVVNLVRSWITRSGTRGLGVAGIDDLTVGGLILVVLGIVAIIALAAALVVGVQVIGNVLIVWGQVYAYGQMLDTRKATYDSCVARGGTETECRASATASAPPPNIVMPPPPAPLVGGGTGLIVGLAIAGAAWYFLATPGGRARAGL